MGIANELADSSSLSSSTPRARVKRSGCVVLVNKGLCTKLYTSCASTDGVSLVAFGPALTDVYLIHSRVMDETSTARI